MTVPVTAKTPVYGIEYIAEGEPIRNTRAKLQRNAETIETALAARGVPPADLQALIAAGWFSDTGWIDLPIAPTFAANGTAKPQGRKIAKIVYLRGGWSSTGMTASAWFSVCTNMPAALRPPQSVMAAVGTRQGTEYGQINLTGATLSLRTGPALSNYYDLSGISYPGD